MDYIILRFNSEEMKVHWARNSRFLSKWVAVQFPPISSNKISTCSHCVSCKNYEWSRKRMKKLFFWVSEISKHQNVRWVATYVNFDIYKLGLLKQTLLKQRDFDLHPSLNRHKFTAAFQALAEGQKLFSWRMDELYSARERPEHLLLYQLSAP